MCLVIWGQSGNLQNGVLRYSGTGEAEYLRKMGKVILQGR